MAKRIIAIFLTAVLVIGACFVSAFAASPYKYGDVDMNGKINSTDAFKVLQFSTGLTSLDSRRQALADANGNGKVNSSDALEILKAATGLISSVTKTDANTLKTKVVEPVFASEKHTVGVTLTYSGLSFDCSVATDGKAKTTSVYQFAMIDNKLQYVEMRFLEKDGKTYIILPSQKKYCEADVPTEILIFGDMISLVCQSDVVYGATTTERVGLKSYTCETYYDSPESYVKYYFDGNKFAKLKCGDSSETVEFTINEFKATAASTLFTIPSDYTVDETLKDSFK